MPKAVPAKVTLQKAAALSFEKVKLSWKKASNVVRYQICYRKYGSKTFKTIATVSGNRTSYIHRSSGKYPLKPNTRYTYAVRGYNKAAGKYGPYSKAITVKTPGKAAGTEKPEKPQKEKARYSYELKLMNPYKELYASSSTSGPIIYIKTKNPNRQSILLVSEPDIKTNVVLDENSFADVKGVWAGNWLKVEGGYLCQFGLEKAGSYKFKIYEIKEEYIDYAYWHEDHSPQYCYRTDASLNITVKDYLQAKKEWLEGLIKTYTTPDMTPKEKFEAVADGEFYLGNPKYRYMAVKYDPSYGDYVYTELLSEIGAVWQNSRMDSYSSPRLLCDLGYLVGYDVKMITGDVSDPLHAYVKGPDEERYMICPMMETGIVDKITEIDFSKY